MLRGCSRSTQADVLSMARKDLRKIVGFISRKWSFNGHLHRMDIHMETLQCSKCRLRTLEVSEEGSADRMTMYEESQGFVKAWDLTAC